ncbi:MAG: DEAD/DEAH box helicase [Chloroflexi bacterium]|nr:DEAD/DEAH box helicase [Chloroflexota bacterium]
MSIGYRPDRPLIVQADRSLLLEVDNPLFGECRDRLAGFAELRKSPEHIHTYAVTPLSLWNACAAGLSVESVLDTLQTYSKYDIPGNVLADVRDLMGRYGRLRLMHGPDGLTLETDEPDILEQVRRNARLSTHLGEQQDERRALVPVGERGRLKQALLKAGLPVEDLAGYADGSPLALDLLESTNGHTARGTASFALRGYQRDAIDAFWSGGGPRGGSGVLVLPCGAGKTLIGLGVMARARTSTLIMCTGISAIRQWQRELLSRTSATPDMIGEYTGERKEIRPITLATYQVMTARSKGQKDTYPHLDLFTRENWGLIVYDEVHLLPAPVFRITAEIQSRRRLGLTATLIREDGNEEDVFSLIGPKKFDAPWKDLEAQGWIAPAVCTEVRVPMSRGLRMEYASAETRQQYRVAATNPDKLLAMLHLLERHRKDHVLIIGQYLDQLETVSDVLKAPIITGKTPNRAREKLYDQFRSGEVRRLVVSKVANFAIDLPEANVAIELSGTFGSRQEEAQRLGRVLRPKADGGQAYFYAVVSHDSVDQEYADHRQLFLTEQGYRYEIEDFTPARA